MGRLGQQFLLDGVLIVTFRHMHVAACNTLPLWNEVP